jgi:DNA invertase Pin-like site-specific DNA recombinase
VSSSFHDQPVASSVTIVSRLFAEFETNLRKERQLEGIAKAKAAGVYKGRPVSIDPAQIQQLKAEGMGPSQIAKHLGIGRASVYRALEA